jgi:proteasome lid subunit RPN8/RPN11
MITRVALSPEGAAAIVAAAHAAHPRECCGLLEGERDGDCVTVTMLHPARNLSGDADRFEIDPADHIRAQKAAHSQGRAIVGCYHSHPGGVARPSARDAQGAAQDDFVWLIAAQDEVAAFVYSGGVFRGVMLGADCVMSSL